MASTRISRDPAGTLSSVKRPLVPVRVPMFRPPIVTSAAATGSPVAATLTAPSTVPVCAATGRAPSDRPSVIATAARTPDILGRQSDVNAGIVLLRLRVTWEMSPGGAGVKVMRPGGFEPPTNSLEGTTKPSVARHPTAQAAKSGLPDSEQQPND